MCLLLCVATFLKPILRNVSPDHLHHPPVPQPVLYAEYHELIFNPRPSPALHYSLGNLQQDTRYTVTVCDILLASYGS